MTPKSRKHRKDRGERDRPPDKDRLTINKIAAKIHAKLGVSYHDTRLILRAAVLEMADGIVAGRVVVLRGLGTLRNRYRAPIKWRKTSILKPKNRPPVAVNSSRAGYIVAFRAHPWLKAANFKALHGELPNWIQLTSNRKVSKEKAAEAFAKLAAMKAERRAARDREDDSDYDAQFIERLLLATPEPVEACRRERKRMVDLHGPSKQGEQGPETR